ncbi:MAG TPA: prepilin-type N-terminal cleavage/methylation domain-containing protein [Verrucomicrobiae bacterium]|jgi:prepilin-type N-terminal cleavage/methylation domain-containing protein|nr:prepilin-type N-terminal cleavage/methylation domain-containing protein [Verrucomicrobiae bacterium]
MISLKKRNLDGKGFTIVELLIVIVVIGILALLVITTYSGIQAKARNAKRQTDIQSLQTQLEAFFSQNGYYPSLGDMNSASWRGTNMKSLDVNALVDPSSNCDPSSASCLVSSPTNKAYAYAVTDSSGNSCESTDTNCAKYTLTAEYEGTVNGQSTYTKSNLD